MERNPKNNSVRAQPHTPLLDPNTIGSMSLIAFQAVCFRTKLQIMFITCLRLRKVFYAVLQEMSYKTQHDKVPQAWQVRIQPSLS